MSFEMGIWNESILYKFGIEKLQVVYVQKSPNVLILLDNFSQLPITCIQKAAVPESCLE